MNDRMNEKESPVEKYKFKKSGLSARDKIGEKDFRNSLCNGKNCG